MNRIWELTLFVSCRCGNNASFSGSTKEGILQEMKNEEWAMVGDLNFCPNCLHQNNNLGKNLPMQIEIPANELVN